MNVDERGYPPPSMDEFPRTVYTSEDKQMYDFPPFEDAHRTQCRVLGAARNATEAWVKGTQIDSLLFRLACVDNILEMWVRDMTALTVETVPSTAPTALSRTGAT